MKWVFLTVLVVVAGAVGSFAIYTFGYRTGGSGELARAWTDAQEFQALTGSSTSGSGGQLREVDRISPGLWRARFATADGTIKCWAIDLATFQVPPTWRGIGPVPCP